MRRLPYIYSQQLSKPLLMAGIIIASVYLWWWFLPGHVGTPLLYWLLVVGEVYHVVMLFTFWFTLWPGDKSLNIDSKKMQREVDIFITVAGEPVDIVEQTALAAKSISYPHKKIYLLNDGYVAKKDNWKDIELLAKQLHINCFTRKTPGGAKAGNINNALRQTKGEYIVIFDADMKPHQDFLEKTMNYFQDPKVAFVQTPQYYHNFASGEIASSAWDQQALFFGPIMRGKDKSNASFICGTNIVLRRQALEEVGGMDEENIAEDFLTSQYIHRKGWLSVYQPEVLAEGLAPEDLSSYYKQQLRWARGSIETLFKHNPLLSSLSWPQKIEYFSSGLFYLNGVVVLIDMLMPLIYLFFGYQPVSASTTNFAIFFIPFVTLSLLILSQASMGHFTFRAMSFTHSSWIIHVQALLSIILNQKMGFSITPKKAQTGNFLSLAYPHLIYACLLLVGIIFAISRQGITPAIATNIAWGTFNVIFFLPYIATAYPWAKLFHYGGRLNVVSS